MRVLRRATGAWKRAVWLRPMTWLQKDHQWPGMRSVAKVESRRELLVEGKVEEETRYYISSCRATPSR